MAELLSPEEEKTLREAAIICRNIAARHRTRSFGATEMPLFLSAKERASVADAVADNLDTVREEASKP